MNFGVIVFGIVLLIGVAVIATFITVGIFLIRALSRYVKSGNVRKEKSSIKKSLGEVLKQHREECKMTQEFVAESIGVSRQAVSKWETGRGYPSIDSLKEISRYFSVSIDELLSGDQLVLIAEKENKSNLNGLCDLLFGFTDLLSLMLIFLPLYSKPVDGYIYSVSLIEYVDNEIWIRMTYWGLFIALTIIGIVNILMVNFKFEKGKKVITFLSVGLSIITVLYLAIAREPYAVTVAFLLLLIKGGLLYKRAMAGR